MPKQSRDALSSVSVPISLRNYKVDGIALSEEEIRLAMVLIEKLTRRKCEVINFAEGSRAIRSQPGWNRARRRCKVCTKTPSPASK